MILMGNQVENHWSKFGCEDCMVVTASPMGMRVGVESSGGMGKDRGCESLLTLTTDSKARGSNCPQRELRSLLSPSVGVPRSMASKR